MPPAEAPEECLHQPTPTRGLHRHTITTAEVFTPLTAASPWAREPHRQTQGTPQGAGQSAKMIPPEQAIPQEALPILLSPHPTLVTAGLARPTQQAEGELSVLTLRVVPPRITWPRTCPTPSNGKPNCPRTLSHQSDWENTTSSPLSSHRSIST